MTPRAAPAAGHMLSALTLSVLLKAARCRSLRHSAEVAAALAPAAQSGAVVRASAEKSLKIGIRLAQALPIFSFLLSGIKPLRGYLLFHP